MKTRVSHPCLLVLLLLCAKLAHGQLPPNATAYTAQVNAETSPGYIFISPAPQVPVFSEPANLMVLDSSGELIWYAPIADENQAPFQTVFLADFKPLRNGTMSYFRPGDGGGKFFILDSTFQLVDSVWCNGIAWTDAHDLDLDEDGNYTLMCDSTVVGDASVLTTNTGIQGSSMAQIHFQIVQKQRPDRSVLWNWSSLDYQPIANSDTAQFSIPSSLDHIHMNSTWEDGQGRVVTSSRSLNEITRFDPVSGAIDWRMGGKGNDFALIGDTEFFSAQHDANFAPSGNLYLFDNGSVGAHRVARYVEYELDTLNMTATLVREHRHPNGLLSRYMGNAILLPNDNVLVSWGGVFPEDSTTDATEFAPDGSIAMEIDFDGGYFSYRAHKEVLPWELVRPMLTCDDGLQTLSAPAGHASYWWNTGETTREITVTSTGRYQVWVDHGIGFIGSEPVWVTDVGQVCLALEQEEAGLGNMAVGPNPTEDLLQLWLPNALQSGWELSVYDGLGRMVYEKSGKVLKTTVEMGDWPRGVYVLVVKGAGKSYRERVLRW